MPSFLNRLFENVTTISSRSLNTNSSFAIPQNAPLPGLGTEIPYPDPTVRHPSLPPYPFHEIPFGALMRGNTNWISDPNSTQAADADELQTENNLTDDNPFSDAHRASVSAKNRDTKSLAFLPTTNALGMTFEKDQNRTTDTEVSSSDEVSKPEEPQALKYSSTPPLGVKKRETQPLSTSGNTSASESQPTTKGEHKGSTSLSLPEANQGDAPVQQHEHGEGSLGVPDTSLETPTQTSSAVQPTESRVESISWDEFPEPVWSDNSTSDSKPGSKPIRPISLTSESSVASSSVFTFTTHSSSDSVSAAFVPSLTSSSGSPRPIRPISLASEVSEASSVAFSFTTHCSSIVSVRSNGSIASMDSVSTVRPRRELDSGSETRSNVTVASEESLLAPPKPLNDSVGSGSSSKLKSSAPELEVRSLERNSTKSSKHSKRSRSTQSPASDKVLVTPPSHPSTATKSTQDSATAPTPVLSSGPGTSTLPSENPAATPSQPPSGSTSKSRHSSGKSKSSSRQDGEVVNKLTQYIEVSEGPLRMLPKYGGAIVPVKDKSSKPRRSATAKTEETPTPTSDKSSASQSSRSTQKSSSSQGSKHSEVSTSTSTSESSSAVETKSSTPRATSSKTDSHPKPSSDSSSQSKPELPFKLQIPDGYKYVAYEEYRGYYYVVFENKKGRQMGKMVLKRRSGKNVDQIRVMHPREQ